jgi:hypothetical protein
MPPMVAVSVVVSPQSGHVAGRGQAFVDKDRVRRKATDDLQRYPIGIDWNGTILLQDFPLKPMAICRPVSLLQAFDAVRGELRQRRTSCGFDSGNKNAQGFPYIGLESDLGGKILREIVVN